jgi:hypothetical protein
MAILKAGGISTLLNGWWQSAEMSHALNLTEPKLIIADEPRAKRISAACGPWPMVALPIERPIAEALEPLTGGETSDAELPEIGPEDDCDHPLHFGIDRRGQGRAVDAPGGDHGRLHLCDVADDPAWRHAEHGRGAEECA